VVVSVLLSAGAMVDAQDRVSPMISSACLNSLQWKRTPLHITCEQGSVEVTSALLSAGAMVDSRQKVSAV
jgi:ankyrin repeat protein